jgi:hypothetical protein
VVWDLEPVRTVGLVLEVTLFGVDPETPASERSPDEAFVVSGHTLGNVSGQSRVRRDDRVARIFESRLTRSELHPVDNELDREVGSGRQSIEVAQWSDVGGLVEHQEKRWVERATLLVGEGQAFTVLPDADPIGIKAIRTPPTGPPEVWLEDFDTDEIADDEAVAVEALLASGWEVDID